MIIYRYPYQSAVIVPDEIVATHAELSWQNCAHPNIKDKSSHCNQWLVFALPLFPTYFTFTKDVPSLHALLV
jgi:hypothetical protein